MRFWIKLRNKGEISRMEGRQPSLQTTQKSMIEPSAPGGCSFLGRMCVCCISTRVCRYTGCPVHICSNISVKLHGNKYVSNKICSVSRGTSYDGRQISLFWDLKVTFTFLNEILRVCVCVCVCVCFCKSINRCESLEILYEKGMHE